MAFEYDGLLDRFNFQELCNPYLAYRITSDKVKYYHESVNWSVYVRFVK